MDGFLLDGFNLQRIQFLVKHLHTHDIQISMKHKYSDEVLNSYANQLAHQSYWQNNKAHLY